MPQLRLGFGLFEQENTFAFIITSAPLMFAGVVSAAKTLMKVRSCYRELDYYLRYCCTFRTNTQTKEKARHEKVLPGVGNG